MKAKLYITALLAVAAAGVKAQFVIDKHDGTVENTTVNNISFAPDGDSWKAGTVNIGDIRSITLNTLENRLAAYVAPVYNDNYTGITNWYQRGKWNLANVHDPTVMRAADGYYYMYQTDAGYGNPQDGHGHFHARRSRNLVDWEYLGATMNTVPSWVADTVNSYRAVMGLNRITNFRYGYWAPCARMVNDTLYRMYYCIVIDNYIKTGAAATEANFDGSWTERALIGVMETSDPASNVWTDKGFVLGSSTDKGMNGYSRTSTADWGAYFKFNAIDPSYIITPEGQHWLIYGSWHSGFAAVQLAAETGMPLKPVGYPWGDISAYGTLVNTRTTGSRWQGSEAPEVVYHDGYYYLFMAYDGLAVPYNTRVVRSKNITGPYYGKDGRNVTAGGEAYPVVTHPYKFAGDQGWVGISHCAVFDDGQGNWYYASQQRMPENVEGIWASNALMMGGVRSIKWVDGWPVVMPERYAAVPQAAISESELAGQWEHITLTYHYGQQDGSVPVALLPNHTVKGGPFNGKAWSYDPDTRLLTVGGVKMAVSRETDWEASPRKPMLAYSGINGNVACWGKKVSENATAYTTVGATDCSSGWNTVFSDYYTLAPGKTLCLAFVNHTKGTENWQNWNLCVTNDADRGSADRSEYFVLRSDAYGWGNSDFKAASIATANYPGWATFRQLMEGAYVRMTVKREGANIIVTAVATAANGRMMTETYTQACGDGSQAVRAYLICDNSYFEINPEETYIK